MVEWTIGSRFRGKWSFVFFVVESIIFNQFILFVEMMLSRMQKFNKSEIDYQAAQKQLFNDFTVD